MKSKAGSLTNAISKALKQTVFVKPSRVWLKISAKGFQYLHGVLGSKKLGIPAGKLYHIAGKKHGGKTAEVAMFAGEAQRQFNAFVIWIDAENSFSKPWFTKQGVSTGEKETDYNNDNFRLIYPKMLVREKVRRKGKKKKVAGEVYLQSCEFLFKEAEDVMIAVKGFDKDRPIFVACDSFAALQTELAIEMGLTDGNMRSAQDRAIWASQTMLPRWTALAKNFTAWVFFINQIRTKPGVPFGNPEYSPGGNALEHYCHVMALIRRKSGTVMLKDGKKVAKGITGYMVNTKNKAGGGSEEGLMCDYSVDLVKGRWAFKDHKKKEPKEE